MLIDDSRGISIDTPFTTSIDYSIGISIDTLLASFARGLIKYSLGFLDQLSLVSNNPSSIRIYSEKRPSYHLCLMILRSWFKFVTLEHKQ